MFLKYPLRDFSVLVKQLEQAIAGQVSVKAQSCRTLWYNKTNEAANATQAKWCRLMSKRSEGQASLNMLLLAYNS